MPSSRTASTVIEATSRTPPASSSTLAIASPALIAVTRAGSWLRALSFIWASSSGAVLAALHDHSCRLHHSRCEHTRRELELVRRLPRHEGHDPEGTAGHVHLRHHAVLLHRHDHALHPVARARALVGAALLEQVRELVGRDEALGALPL